MLLKQNGFILVLRASYQANFFIMAPTTTITNGSRPENYFIFKVINFSQHKLITALHVPSKEGKKKKKRITKLLVKLTLHITLNY